ncbi:MAG: hypothetical protein OXF56_23705 [Rhodobacteraceae bacterium]|nr:hypothetical protein [Paracoccaceae bacterium]
MEQNRGFPEPMVVGIAGVQMPPPFRIAFQEIGRERFAFTVAQRLADRRGRGDAESPEDARGLPAKPIVALRHAVQWVGLHCAGQLQSGGDKILEALPSGLACNHHVKRFTGFMGLDQCIAQHGKGCRGFTRRRRRIGDRSVALAHGGPVGPARDPVMGLHNSVGQN